MVLFAPNGAAQPRCDTRQVRKHSSARLRGLAAEIRELRSQAGLNTREAAELAGISRATLNRMELGLRAIEPEDMSALLVAYGISGAERANLLSRARDIGLPDWWEYTGDSGVPRHLPALITFESEATRIVNVAMLRIPGLLQIPDHIRTIMSSAGMSAAAQET